MIDFFYNLADTIEQFFETSAATAIGALFIIIMAALILLLMKYYEQN